MYSITRPENEIVRGYEPGSKERESLKLQLTRMSDMEAEIPCVIDGKEVFTQTRRKVVMPHEYRHALGEFSLAEPVHLEAAVQAARRAKPAWEAMAWQDRVSIFLKAADLLAGPYRDILNAATMLGQSKNAYQAEIDSACELIDFFRLNAYFYQEILKEQPASGPGVWNRTEYRPLEGFVLAITPFNFTAIAANLPAVAAMLGNTVVWKPSDTQMLSAHYTMKLLQEAGLPPGVINMVAADGPLAGKTLLPMRDLAGVHFTGSTATFQHIWKTVGENIGNYAAYPRLVGETGGKDFVFAHPSADVDALATALVRGAFEYQGQKCSAASRAYIPKGIWKKVQDRVRAIHGEISMGDVREFKHFVNAVIDEKALKRIASFIEGAKNSTDSKVILGGKVKSEKGYFVEPTLILTQDPKSRCMVEEIFGPVLTVFVYDEANLDETIDLCNTSAPYALTGAIFAQDRYAVQYLSERLKNAAGNFYVNDKPTGAVVGQQPFGGGRASGTNDKAGSALNLHRWLSPRSIKETFVPVKDYRYPFMSHS